MVERQDSEFERLGLSFQRLGSRRLHLIDCQNLFCEISKYARAAHPDVAGLSGRTRIKQAYRVDSRPMAPIVLPRRWCYVMPPQFDVHIAHPLPADHTGASPRKFATPPGA